MLALRKIATALAAALIAGASAFVDSAGDKGEPSSACSVLSSSLLACLDDFIHVRCWPNLENVAVSQRRMPADELYSMIHVPRLKNENAAAQGAITHGYRFTDAASASGN